MPTSRTIPTSLPATAITLELAGTDAYEYASDVPAALLCTYRLIVWDAPNGVIGTIAQIAESDDVVRLNNLAAAWGGRVTLDDLHAAHNAVVAELVELGCATPPTRPARYTASDDTAQTLWALFHQVATTLSPDQQRQVNDAVNAAIRVSDHPSNAVRAYRAALSDMGVYPVA